MDTIQKMLLSHPISGGFTVEQVDQIAKFTTYLEFHRDEYVFRQGERAEHFFLILNGSVQVELFSGPSGPVSLQKVGEGDVLGWSWLVPPYRWRFDARVLTPLKTLKVDAKNLKILMEQNPQVGYAVLKRFIQLIGDRLESERFKLIELYASHS